MKLKKILKKLSLILLIPFGYLLLYFSSTSSNLAESIYSQGIYRIIARFFSLITGFIPVSVGEVLVISAIIFILLKLVQTVVKAVKTPSRIVPLLSAALVNALAAISIIYFSFVILWGINYQRLPFSQIVNYNTQPASAAELAEVCKSLVSSANELRKSVEENDNGVMKLSTDTNTTLKRAYKGYERVDDVYPALYGNYGRPKGVLLSEVMSYLGIEGVYFPFTGEANVNISIPHSSLPFTTCHEVAHQKGFSREDEANYIAYLACKYHPDEDFRYSGTLMAMTYATNALYKYDRDKYLELSKNYSEGVVRDLKAIRKYWQKYETPVQEISSSVNNTYLKANMQKDGVRSYGRMVDLLIAEYRHQKGAN
ncbi:MAG: DUF3810 domain-containing protein [Bacillota bacterium]